MAQYHKNMSVWSDMSIRGLFLQCDSAKKNPTCWSRTKRTSSSSHWKLVCSRHDITGKLLWVGVRQQSLTHSYCYHYNILNISPITPHTHLFTGNTIIIIIRHPSYCNHYILINIFPITPHIYIIQLLLYINIFL